jgi:transposase
VNESIRPLLRLSRDSIVRLKKTEYALVSSLQRDPLLAERIRHLRTVPGVGPITALTWALEMGDVSRFPSIREAISYCRRPTYYKMIADTASRAVPRCRFQKPAKVSRRPESISMFRQILSIRAF